MRIPLPPAFRHLGGARDVTEWARAAKITRSALRHLCREQGCLQPFRYLQLRDVIAVMQWLERGSNLTLAARYAGVVEVTFSLFCFTMFGRNPIALRDCDWRWLVGRRFRQIDVRGVPDGV